jgi:aerobic-type carbon monoxide dehydrogenase small subunit (CoxS/CutS family)
MNSVSFFYWNETRIEFDEGETFALALRKAHVTDFGPTPNGGALRYFCGIGQCQGCLVSVNGAAPVESCLTPATSDAVLTSGF